MLLVLHVDRIIGVLLDISELKTSRHKALLLAWMDTSNGVYVGADDGMNVGFLEVEGEFDSLTEGRNEGLTEDDGNNEGLLEDEGEFDGLDVKDGFVESRNDGLLEDEGEFDCSNDSDEMEHALPKTLDVWLEPKSPPSIIIMP